MFLRSWLDAVHRVGVTNRDKCRAVRSVASAPWEEVADGSKSSAVGQHPRARLMVDGVTYTATFGTEVDAREWSVVTRARALGVRAGRTVTIEDYARRWPGEFIDAAPGLDDYRRHVEQQIVPTLGLRPLAQVDAVTIETLLEQVRVTESPAEAEQFQVTLRELFADAVDDGLLPDSPLTCPTIGSAEANRRLQAILSAVGAEGPGARCRGSIGSRRHR